jgi:DNA polymerase delta subunit 1
MSSAGRGGKRRGAPTPGPSGAAAKRAQPSPGTPQRPPSATAAGAPAVDEEDMVDEDVFLDEAILAEDEAALLMVQRDEALASRLSRWKRPALPTDLVAGCSRSVGTDHSPY